MARMDMGMDRFAVAAQSGAPDALFELGILYATGLDVEADLVAAHKWFNLAAMRGNRSALAHRSELAREMSAGQIAQAQKLAREWLTLSGSVCALRVCFAAASAEERSDERAIDLTRLLRGGAALSAGAMAADGEFGCSAALKGRAGENRQASQATGLAMQRRQAASGSAPGRVQAPRPPIEARILRMPRRDALTACPVTSTSDLRSSLSKAFCSFSTRSISFLTRGSSARPSGMSGPL